MAPACPECGSGGSAPVPVPERTRRVLLVDDEPNIITALRRLLRREPYELVTAASGEDALALMQQQPVDVIISDYRMSGMNGIELLRQIQDHWPDTIRLVLSGYSEVKAIIAAINEGAIYKFMTKPWNDEELLLNIRRAVEQYEMEGQIKRMAREIARQNEQLIHLNRQLSERATDAFVGQSLAQDLLEQIEAGMVVVDVSGLIVAANRQACDLLAPAGRELIGATAWAVLPPELCACLFGQDAPIAAPGQGIIEIAGSRVEYRTRPFGQTDGSDGTVITLWEEVV